MEKLVFNFDPENEPYSRRLGGLCSASGFFFFFFFFFFSFIGDQTQTSVRPNAGRDI